MVLLNDSGMKFVPEHMEYKVRQSNSSYLLWLKNLNRYLRLEEPAFRIFRKFADVVPAPSDP